MLEPHQRHENMSVFPMLSFSLVIIPSFFPVAALGLGATAGFFSLVLTHSLFLGSVLGAVLQAGSYS